MSKGTRLIWRLYPAYLLLTVVALGAAGWYVLNSLGEYIYRRAQADLLNQARIVQLAAAPHLNPLDAMAIYRLCKEIGGVTPTRITVILPDGRVIGDSNQEAASMENHRDRPEVQAAARGETGISRRYSRTLKTRMLYAALPLVSKGKVLGILRTSIPLTDIDAQLATLRQDVTMGGLLIALLASVVCFFVSRRISHPIEKLTQGAQTLADGDLSHRLAVPDIRETAALATAMNAMAERLEQRIEAETTQRNKMEAILSSMDEGVAAVDMNDQILSFNRAAAGMVQGLGNDSIGRAILDVVRNTQLQEFMERAKQGNAPISADILFPRVGQAPDPGGAARGALVAHAHASPLRDYRDNRIGTLLVLTDVTQLRRLENMRRDFVANVSHEIKTPLTAIKGFVETLQAGAKDNAGDLERFLSIIDRHATRLEAFVENLLQLSRIEGEDAGRAIELSDTALLDVLSSSVQFCRSQHPDKSLDIQVNCDKSLRALVNPLLLEQALINLIENGLKHGGEGGTVELHAEARPDGVRIEVRDNGVGIAAEHRDRIFERFYRVDKARSRDQGGVGLGLSIVKHIVRAHGGWVSVDSEKGRGSVFTLHLPG